MTPTVTPAESVTAATPAAPAFDSANQHTWSPEQRADWNKTGNIPLAAQTSDSATEEETETENAAPDSAPGTKADGKAAKPSDSATDTSQRKPHLKTKEDTERRFQELTERLKTAEDALRQRAPEKREPQQVSQPAPEYKPLDEAEYFTANRKATYKDFVNAAAKHEAKYESQQAVERYIHDQEIKAIQSAYKEQLSGAKERYPDAEQKIFPATRTILEDQAVPVTVKQALNDSPVLVDLMYVLGDAAALQDFLATAKSNPAAAIRKIVLTEQLILEELGKGKAGDGKAADGKAVRGADGKFVSSDGKAEASAAEPKPRAPKPLSEVGGRGTAPEDVLRTAAAANDFRSFEQEQNRRLRASQKS